MPLTHDPHVNAASYSPPANDSVPCLQSSVLPSTRECDQPSPSVRAALPPSCRHHSRRSMGYSRQSFIRRHAALFIHPCLPSLDPRIRPNKLAFRRVPAVSSPPHPGAVYSVTLTRRPPTVEVFLCSASAMCRLVYVDSIFSDQARLTSGSIVLLRNQYNTITMHSFPTSPHCHRISCDTN